MRLPLIIQCFETTKGQKDHCALYRLWPVNTVEHISTVPVDWNYHYMYTIAHHKLSTTCTDTAEGSDHKLWLHVNACRHNLWDTCLTRVGSSRTDARVCTKSDHECHWGHQAQGILKHGNIDRCTATSSMRRRAAVVLSLNPLFGIDMGCNCILSFGARFAGQVWQKYCAVSWVLELIVNRKNAPFTLSV